ncbi:interleukin-11 receptor subunit alpha isoform X1 [Tachysurus fulvidraco]|uniref:interleukin-11 receptor subunit alpha isoform X1 n=1 Tax=Tachysurus fulvidraco TaxID=1234273 RepID=UPI001FEDC1BF|nr:interleukin-11 receptor subunit alpha isoform X1 [Tachysurus fulvidraco]XP_026996779.2 interleukin-11 receptor subunit alpha isoform X1 [Tachysurus fulvidraco]
MPGFVSCPRGLILIGILIFSCVHINSEILSNEVSDVQFGFLGSTVTLTCRDSHPGFGRFVVWRHNGSLVKTRQTHSSDGTLTLTNTTRSMEGNYSCHEPRERVLLQSITLRLGYAPEYLIVSCKLPSHFKILCTWTQRVRTHLPTKYISSYSVDNNRPEPCEQESMDVNECVIRDPMLWASKHLVNITEVNPLGSKSTIAYVDINKNLKPDAPEELIWEQVNDEPTQLFVRWKPPTSWPSDISVAFPLKFELQYKPVGSKFWSKMETEDTSMVIMDALMGHLHHIRVRAQDAFINHSQWSEWSQVVQAQPWSDPSMIPEATTDNVFEPIFPSTFPVKATEKSADPSFEENGSQVLIILGLLAAVMVVVVFTITVLLCVRNRRRGNVTKQELTSMVKMKSLLI